MERDMWPVSPETDEASRVAAVPARTESDSAPKPNESTEGDAFAAAFRRLRASVDAGLDLDF